MDEIIVMFESGGPMMYPLVISAFVALVLIVERVLALREKKILIPELQRFIISMKKESDFEHAEQLSKTYPGPFANIMLVGLENRHLDIAEINQFLEAQGQYEVRYLEKGLNILETIAGIAPLMGLLGTVFGIIRVFDKIKEVGLSDPGAFSGGISEALVTTAVGLVIGITVLIFHNLLSQKAENLIAEIERIATHLIQRIKQIEVLR
ncbi:MAG: MotA/TolQ/ExbB proton channel family protein [Calditrichaeota bacterium]|nr:MotA/TolQ/ExbB proton channel family protein [Calditrichota bacterium]